MLKGTIFSIVPSLTKLSNLSIQHCSFLELWKYARIVLIPKKGYLSLRKLSSYLDFITPEQASNLERHIYQIISNHLCIHYPISDRLRGFSCGKSTTTALLSCSHNCLQTLDNKAEVCSVFFDISKAFARFLTFTYFKSYPQPLRTSQDGTQCVVVNGTKSPALPVVSTIPQGSVLSPLLFLIYINDVTCVVSNGKIIIYADDMAKKFKYLGVTFSSDASWTSHINTICLKTRKLVLYCASTFEPVKPFFANFACTLCIHCGT